MPMKMNLIELIQNALDSRAARLTCTIGERNPEVFCAVEIETEKLDLNCLEEAITNLIDTRIAKALNDVQP